MGLLSPAATDALFLEKMKLLLQAALSNPKRRGPATSFEAFVQGLDVHDESARRVVEVLLYETTTRRPPRTAPGSGPTASTSTGTRRSREVLDDSYVRLSTSRLNPLIDFSESDSDSTDSQMAVPTTRRSLLRPTGIRAARRAGLDDDPSPTLADRDRQLEDLFGGLDSLPSFSQVLSDLSSSTPAAHSASSISIAAPSFPDQPTFEELWGILCDDPFPSPSVTSFSSFLDCLNASLYSTSPLTSADMHGLLLELTRRDPALPVRVRNAVHRRGAGTNDVSPLREGIWHASFVEHLDDGTERALPVDAGGAGRSGGEAAAVSFADFARRRRAERRLREEEGGAAPGAGGSSNGAMDVEEEPGTPTITVTDAASTPATSAALSPAASGTDCPPALQAVASAAALPPLPPPRTSAAIAEAAFREQRRIARLPSPGASGASSPAPRQATTAASRPEPEQNPSLQAVVYALEQARRRTGGSTASAIYRSL
ncbi:hypothetical protein JCM10213_004941 [Rhodosporidiobolus nylandii]